MAGSLGALGGLVLFVTICKALLSAGFEVTERWRKTTREEGRVNRRGDAYSTERCQCLQSILVEQ